MPRSVYINKIAKHLPNESVSNDNIEDHLGNIYNHTSKSKPIVLRSNKITNRYYAIDAQGNVTDTNAGMTAKAIKGLVSEDFSLEDIDMISTGTGTPDQLLPSHAAMVHGELKSRPVEVNSFMGACVSGMQALKSAWLGVKSGEMEHAVATGSERSSTWLHAKNYTGEFENSNGLKEQPMLAFDKEFLRWMLSDGAGAALLESEKRGDMSLRIEWIDIISYANELDSCMYAGSRKNEDGSLTGWSELEEKQWANESIFALKQDVKLLASNIMRLGGRFFVETLERHNLAPDDIDYFLPHISSEFFRSKLHEELARLGKEITEDKWYTNLASVGNVGSASIFLILEELLYSGKLKKGDKLFLCVPESARFQYAYALLTVV